MAFPYDIHVNFEDGTDGVFDAEVDTQPKLDIAHYSELARTPGNAAPFSGAYCMRINLAVGTTTAYLREDDNDLALNAAASFRFYFYCNNMTMANNDEFIILAGRSASAYEFVVSVNFTTANGLRIGVGNETAAALTPLSQGAWHLVELSVNIDAGGGNDGDINWWVDGVAQTAVATLDQLATTNLRFGAMDMDAGTTSGLLLFDDFVMDSARVFGTLPQDRFSTDRVLLGNGHVFVGPGCIENATLLAAETADCGLRLWDTDIANTDGIGNEKLLLRNTATTGGEVVDPAGVPIQFKRGCYCTLTGASPDALGPWGRFKIDRAIAYGSDGAIRSYGLRRKGSAI